MHGPKLGLDGDIEVDPDTVHALRHSAVKPASTSTRNMLVFCHAKRSACDHAAEKDSVY